MSKVGKKPEAEQELAFPYDKTRAEYDAFVKDQKARRLADALREREDEQRKAFYSLQSQVMNGAVMLHRAWMKLYRAFAISSDGMVRITFPLLKKMNLPPRFALGNTPLGFPSKEEILGKKTAGGASALFGDQVMLESAALMTKMYEIDKAKSEKEGDTSLA